MQKVRKSFYFFDVVFKIFTLILKIVFCLPYAIIACFIDDFKRRYI